MASGWQTCKLVICHYLNDWLHVIVLTQKDQVQTQAYSDRNSWIQGVTYVKFANGMIGRKLFKPVSRCLFIEDVEDHSNLKIDQPLNLKQLYIQIIKSTQLRVKHVTSGYRYVVRPIFVQWNHLLFFERMLWTITKAIALTPFILFCNGKGPDQSSSCKHRSVIRITEYISLTLISDG